MSGDKSDYPEVYIPNMVYRKIMHWVRKAGNKEVSGFGNIEISEDGASLTVVDAIMLPQKNSGADTEIDGDDIAKALFLTKDLPGEMKWWWHSHHSMGVFWSGTDMTAIKELSGDGWIVATVFNNKSQSRTLIGQRTPFFTYLDDLELTVVNDPIPDEELQRWNEEYDKNVKKAPVVVSSSKSTGGGSGKFQFLGRLIPGQGQGPSQAAQTKAQGPLTAVSDDEDDDISCWDSWTCPNCTTDNVDTCFDEDTVQCGNCHAICVTEASTRGAIRVRAATSQEIKDFINLPVASESGISDQLAMTDDEIAALMAERYGTTDDGPENGEVYP